MELKKYKLGELGKVITGKTPKTSKKENFDNGVIPFYTPEDIARGIGIIGKNERFITEIGLSEIKNNSLEDESVLVGCIGSDMGNVAYTNHRCAMNQQINAITSFKDYICPLYVYYYLSTKKQEFRKIAGATTTPILPKSVFCDYIILLPKYHIQRKIASVLYNIDRKIEINRAINQNLEAMAKQLYDYWFVQFDFPNEEGKPYKSSGGLMTWNDLLKREIPATWNVVNIFDAVNVRYGFPFATENFTEEATSTPIVRIRDILEGTISAYSLEENDEKYKLQEGDLLVGMDGNFHMNYWHDNTAYLNQRCVRFRMKDDSTISTIQTYYNIQPYIKAKETNAKGSTVGHLSDKDLKELYVIEPQNTNKFHPRVFFDSMLIQMVKNKQQILELTKQRDELLPLLMNGQITIE